MLGADLNFWRRQFDGKLGRRSATLERSETRGRLSIRGLKNPRYGMASQGHYGELEFFFTLSFYFGSLIDLLSSLLYKFPCYLMGVIPRLFGDLVTRDQGIHGHLEPPQPMAPHLLTRLLWNLKGKSGRLALC